MIEEVDRALKTLIENDALRGSGVGVSFEAPSKSWAARRNGPVVNVYLYDVREDVGRRMAQYEEVRRNVDGRAVVVDRRMPPRHYALSYLASAWAQRPEDEHRVLGAVLSCLLRTPALPAPGGEESPPFRMTVGEAAAKTRSGADVWAAFGGDVKPSLEVVVTAPVDPDRHLPVGPLVTEQPVVKMRRRTRGS